MGSACRASPVVGEVSAWCAGLLQGGRVAAEGAICEDYLRPALFAGWAFPLPGLVRTRPANSQAVRVESSSLLPWGARVDVGARSAVLRCCSDEHDARLVLRQDAGASTFTNRMIDEPGQLPGALDLLQAVDDVRGCYPAVLPRLRVPVEFDRGSAGFFFLDLAAPR